jgi:predicted deacetylase
MKFALRDDDLNYFFDPKQIELDFQDIWDICPVSMSAVPFMKGNWKENVVKVEEHGPGKMNSELLSHLISDTKIYSIGENIELVKYIHEKISEGRIYLTLHGVHHRNGDEIIPQFNKNFGIGAEFFTSRDLTQDVKEAVLYMEELFKQKIEVFTPPQNLLSNLGVDALVNNNLSICADLPRLKCFETAKRIRIIDYFKYGLYTFFNRRSIYPHVLINNNYKIIGHHRLQLGTDLEKLYSDFDFIYKKKGAFVLSTHSYGFNHKMHNSDMTMGDALKSFVKYAASKQNIEFVTLNRMFN